MTASTTCRCKCVRACVRACVRGITPAYCSTADTCNGDSLSHAYSTFWNVHEHDLSDPRVYDFTDASRANLTRLLATAAEVGLFVNVRLGPYVCAEWNFGGQ